MRAIEQIAFKSNDIEARIKSIGWMFPFNGNPAQDHMTKSQRITKWVHDRVSAVLVYSNPDYSLPPVGSGFQVQLAFNYDIIDSKELELIQLLSGHTVQFEDRNENEGLSHLGYHIRDGDRLRAEIEWWNTLKFPCAQVAATTDHTGTSKRYLYAFIDTRRQIGAYTKIISRVTYPHEINEWIEEFRHVNTI